MITQLKDRPTLIIMRPTEDCNLNCTYCYNATSVPKVKMTEQTLENSISAILSYYKNPIFLWHGGESTLSGISFLEKALELQCKYKTGEHKIVNEIQTNGILLNEKWIDFFSKNKFYVGISIDGPQNINDKARINKEGGGTYNTIFENILLLKAKNITIAGICVLAQHNIDSMEEVVGFYRKNEIPLNINPFVSSGRGSIFKDELTITPKRYATTLIWLFDQWFYKPDIKIYEFWKIVKSMFTGYNNICCYSGECSKDYLSICPDGSVYPCGRWAGEKDYCMGNINNQKISMIVNSKPVELIIERKKLIKECELCDWFQICNGGCPHTAYVYTGSINNNDYYCHGRKILFSHIYKVLKSELKNSKI